MASCIETGKGVAKDEKRAVAWLQKAAEKGEPMAMNDLGSMYEHGRGVAQDSTKAITWYRRAAALGNEDANATLQRLETPRKSKKAAKKSAEN